MPDKYSAQGWLNIRSAAAAFGCAPPKRTTSNLCAPPPFLLPSPYFSGQNTSKGCRDSEARFVLCTVRTLCRGRRIVCRSCSFSTHFFIYAYFPSTFCSQARCKQAPHTIQSRQCGRRQAIARRPVPLPRRENRLKVKSRLFPQRVMAKVGSSHRGGRVAAAAVQGRPWG